MKWIYLVIGIIIGFTYGVFFLNQIRNKKMRKYEQSIENMFLLILSNFDKLIFTKRINRYAYFIYESWEIIYQLDDKSIHVFSKENAEEKIVRCLATSNQLNGSSVIDKLLSNIDNSWGNDINNTIIIDSNEVSINFVEEQRKKIQSTFIDPILDKIEKENKISYFTVDEILDKINKVGYNNLTQEEKDFLNNASK